MKTPRGTATRHLPSAATTRHPCSGVPGQEHVHAPLNYLTPILQGLAIPAVGLAFLLTGSIAFSANAQAQTAEISAAQPYNIAPGALHGVLNRFAGNAGINLVADPSLTAGLQSSGLQGDYSIQAGFARLLQGSGLEAVETGAGRYALRRVPSASQGVTALEAVEVVGQNDPKEAVYQTAGSVNVLTRDDIERFRGTSVGDIFQGIPGVLVGENRNSGGLDINIRGMQGQGRVPILVDGARQETTVYRGYAGVSSRSYVDPDLIGGIVIEKGPTMAAGGTGATGGLVSMRTLEADDILKEGETFGMRMRGTAIGNNSGSVPDAGTAAGYHFPLGVVYRKDCIIASTCGGAYQMPESFAPEESMDRPSTFKPKSYAGSLALAQRLSHADIVLAYAQRSQGNYYAGKHGPTPSLTLDERKYSFYTEVRPSWEGASRFRGEERVVNSNYESKSLLLKSNIYLSASQQLDLSYLRYRSTYGELMPSQLIWLGSIRQTPNSDVLAHTYTSKYRWRPEGSENIDLRVNLWHTNTDSHNENYASSTPGDFSSSPETEHYKRWGGDISNATYWSTGWGDLKLNYGLAGQREDLRTDSTDGHKGNRQEYSLFTALEWQLSDAWLLDAGLRHTHFSVTDKKLQSQDDTSKKNHQSGTTPLVSLRWEPVDGLQFYARYAEAMRMPSLFESTTGFSSSPALDADLKPEHTRNRELGLNFSHDGWLSNQDKLRMKFAYFHNHTRNYLTRTIPNQWEMETVGEFFTMRNIDSVSVQGLELSASYDLGWMFTEFGGTRYTDIEVCHTGSFRRESCNNYGVRDSYINNMIPPNWHASALLGVRLLDRKLTLGARGTFMGKRNPTPEYDNATANGFLTPITWHAYRIFDVFASYRVNDTLSFDFNIDNITDRYYVDALSLGLVPAPGRTARLSATLQF